MLRVKRAIAGLLLGLSLPLLSRPLYAVTWPPFFPELAGHS